jgi:hypothetical protein
MKSSFVLNGHPRKDWRYWAEFAFAVVLALAAFLFLKHFIDRLKPVGLQEDAMIGLRHFRNLVDHGRLVYNTQTSVMGATDPMFWLVGGLAYAVLRLFGLPMDPVYFTYNFVWLLGLTALVAWICMAGAGRRLAVSALVVTGMALLVMPLRFMWLGLEGPFIMVSVAVIACVARSGRLYLALFVAGLLAWNRPEIAMVGALALALHVIFGLPKGLWIRSAVAAGAGWVIPPLVMKVTTGQWVPNTVLAKAYFGTDTGAIFHAPVTFLTARFDYLDAFVTLGKGGAFVLFLAVLVIAVCRFVVAWRDHGRSGFSWRALMATFTAGYGCFIVSVPNVWEWYITFWLGFAVVVVVQAILDALFAIPAMDKAPLKASFALLLLVGVAAHAERDEARLMRENTTRWLQEERGFRGRLGEDLGTRWQAQSVWMEAVGWQGYYNDARIFDEVGLVDRSVFAYAEHSGCHYFIDAIRELKPQFIVKRAFEVERNRMLTSPRSCPSAPLFTSENDRQWFDEHYRLAERYDSKTPEYFGEFSHLLLFKRID